LLLYVFSSFGFFWALRIFDRLLLFFFYRETGMRKKMDNARRTGPALEKAYQ